MHVRQEGVSVIFGVQRDPHGCGHHERFARGTVLVLSYRTPSGSLKTVASPASRSISRYPAAVHEQFYVAEARTSPALRRGCYGEGKFGGRQGQLLVVCDELREVHSEGVRAGQVDGVEGAQS
jgi:hypothetical protein